MTSYQWLFWLLAATGLVVDQATKYGIFSHLYNDGAGGEIVVIENCFTIEAHFHNDVTGTWTGTTKDGKSVTVTFGPNNAYRVQTDQDVGTGFLADPADVVDRPAFPMKIQWESQRKTITLFEPFNGPLIIENMGPDRKFENARIYTRSEPWQDGDTEVQLEHPPRVNQGALFGIGTGHNSLFAVISIAAAVLIVFFSGRPAARRDLLLSIALGLILAGTLGNFYDRMVFSGVRDFIHWFVKKDGKLMNVFGWPADWPIFNIADCCLVVGAGTLLLHAFFFAEPRASSVVPKEQEPAIAQP